MRYSHNAFFYGHKKDEEEAPKRIVLKERFDKNKADDYFKDQRYGTTDFQFPLFIEPGGNQIGHNWIDLISFQIQQYRFINSLLF